MKALLILTAAAAIFSVAYLASKDNKVSSLEGNEA